MNTNLLKSGIFVQLIFLIIIGSGYTQTTTNNPKPNDSNIVPHRITCNPEPLFDLKVCIPNKNRDSAVTVTDIDGNVYHTVTIGAQTWTVENLRTTKFNDGTAIPLIPDSATRRQLITPGYCWYFNNESFSRDSFGALYNWFAVHTGKLAPAGWHVPSDTEWSELTAYLGGDRVAGGALKEQGISRWMSPNASATNETGFSARPGGGRGSEGGFYGMGRRGHWWTSTPYYASNSFRRSLYSDFVSIERTDNDNSCGYSVRLVKDCIGSKQETIKKQDSISGKIKICNLSVHPKITLNGNEIAFDSLPQNQQKLVDKIWKNFGDYIKINLGSGNDYGVINNEINIDNITTDTVFGLLDTTNVVGRDNNVTITDTLLKEKVIRYCKKILKDAGYSPVKKYSLKLRGIQCLINMYSMINLTFYFNEYYNEIPIERASAEIYVYNGNICSIKIHSFASPNMKVTTLKPKLSLSQAIQIYRNKKHLPLSANVTPESIGGDTTINWQKNNRSIDSLTIKNLQYIPNETKNELRLCWAIFNGSDRWNSFEIDYVDAETGAVTGGIMCSISGY